jgi:hypothetical protein
MTYVLRNMLVKLVRIETVAQITNKLLVLLQKEPVKQIQTALKVTKRFISNNFTYFKKTMFYEMLDLSIQTELSAKH